MQYPETIQTFCKHPMACIYLPDIIIFIFIM